MVFRIAPLMGPSLWTGSLAAVDVAVVGSLNLDTTVLVARLPRPGETVLGKGHFTDTGGKGANQAVGAARLGRSVAMIGMLGDDDGGAALRAVLDREGVDHSGVGVAGVGSGLAHITVDDSGENMIVVDPGANAALDPDHVARHAGILGEAAVTLAQLEVPIDSVTAAAAEAQGRFVLNPAPASHLPGELLERVDVLVPNATELGVLTGGAAPESPDDAVDLARVVEGPAATVVTLGAQGAVVLQEGSATHVPAPVIEVVDPTAAGDAFCAGLADALALGADLEGATEWAVRCGALAATRPGAQSSLPTRERVMEGV